MLNRLPMLLTSVAVGITFAGAALMLIGSEAKARPMSLVGGPSVQPSVPPNVQMNRLFLKVTTKQLPPNEVAKVITEVRKLQKNNTFKVGADYFCAAVIASKGKSVDDALYAHDLAVCALALGDPRAATWAALTQDQVLTRLNQKQRYGTQKKNGQLAPVSGDVADAMRLIVGLPSLISAKRKVESGQSLDPNPHQAKFQNSVMEVMPTTAAIAVAE